MTIDGTKRTMRVITRAFAILGLAIALMLGMGSWVGGGFHSVPDGGIPTHHPTPGATPHPVHPTHQP